MEEVIFNNNYFTTNLICCVKSLLSPVHMLQASEDHHAIGKTTLNQEMEGIPAGETEQVNMNVYYCLNLENICNRCYTSTNQN